MLSAHWRSGGRSPRGCSRRVQSPGGDEGSSRSARAQAWSRGSVRPVPATTSRRSPRPPGPVLGRTSPWAGPPVSRAGCPPSWSGNFSGLKSNPGRSNLPEFGQLDSFDLYFPVIAVLVPRADRRLNIWPSAPRNQPARGRRCGSISTGGISRASIRTPAVGTWPRSSRGWTSLKAHQGVLGSGLSSFFWQLPQIEICCPPQVSIASAGWPHRPQFLLAKRRVLCCSAR